MTTEIKLYGTERCHKTEFYNQFFKNLDLEYTFLDVEASEKNAEELCNLYENRKLNFPTITIGTKKLRNPKKEELEKWLNKLIPSRLNIIHDSENNRFTLNINGDIAKVDYVLRNTKMHLVHSEVPYHLRGKGIGKILVEKTFELLTKEGYKAVAICSYIRAVAMRSEKWRNIIEY